jgi:WD40 repeat protein
MLKIWDVETGEEVARLNGITKTVRSIRVNKECPDLLISGSRDGSIRLYDTRGGSASIREYSPAYGFSRSHDVSGSESRGRRRSVLIAVGIFLCHLTASSRIFH